jgi:hypothetical protein
MVEIDIPVPVPNVRKRCQLATKCSICLDKSSFVSLGAQLPLTAVFFHPVSNEMGARLDISRFNPHIESNNSINPALL